VYNKPLYTDKDIKIFTMKRVLYISAVCLIFASPVFAQTAAEVERLLAADSVTYGQAAWFLSRAAELPASNPEAAFDNAAQRNWLPKNVSAGDTARLDGIALLVMRSFDIGGGVIYSLRRTPHYAYRELVYKNIIQGRTYPSMTVSGSDLIFITNRVFALKDGENRQ